MTFVAPRAPQGQMRICHFATFHQTDNEKLQISKEAVKLFESHTHKEIQVWIYWLRDYFKLSQKGKEKKKRLIVFKLKPEIFKEKSPCALFPSSSR